MPTFRRLVAAVLGLGLAVLTAAFALRWVDVPTREVAAVQAVLPITGGAIAAVTLLAVVFRFWRLAAAGAVPTAVASVLVIASFAPGWGGFPAAGAPPVTVLSSNMEFGGAHPADIVGAVRDRHADVLVLVEVTPAAVTALKAAGLDAELPFSAGHVEPGTTGALVRSRWPVSLLDEGRVANGSLFWEPFVSIARPAGAFRVKAIHTRQPIVSALGWHMDLERIGEWQRQQPSDQPLVLAGDFNASEAHPAFRSMLDGLVDAHRATGSGWVRSWPQGRRVPPFVQLDHVLVRGFTPVDAGVVSVRGTDHAAVWTTLT